MKKNKVIVSGLVALFAVSTLSSVNASADGETKSKGSVKFTTNSGADQPTPFDPTDPNSPPAEIEGVKPWEPGKPGEPGGGTVGLLRFERVPNLAFEDLVVSSKTVTSNVLEEKYKLKVAPAAPAQQEYYAAPTVEITDLTGSNDGWTASVQIDDKFVDSTGSEFVGFVTFKPGRVASYTEQDASIFPTTPSNPITLNGAAAKFASAEEGKGAYQWGISYYTGDHANDGKPKKNYTAKPNADEAIQLTVKPGQKVNLDSVYETNLTWTLVPGDI